MNLPKPGLPLKPFRGSLSSIPRYSESFLRPRRKMVNPFREGDVIQVNFPSGLPMRWRICILNANVVHVESLPNLVRYPIDKIVLIEMVKDDRITVVPREIANLSAKIES